MTDCWQKKAPGCFVKMVVLVQVVANVGGWSSARL